MKEDKKIRMATIMCPHCHTEFDVEADNILPETDWTCAFDLVRRTSIQCPVCLNRCILSYRDKDGHETTYIEPKIWYNQRIGHDGLLVGWGVTAGSP